jgi:GDP-D-mannose dehydratase
MRANPHKANERLGWHAEVNFEEIVRRMVLADYQRLSASMTGQSIESS